MRIKAKININKLYCTLLIAALSLNIKTGIVYFIFLTILIIWLISGNWRFLKFSKIEDYYPLSLLLIWIYGILRGFICGNNPSYIIANFAGLSCYVLYYVLSSSDFRVETLKKIIILSGLIVSIIATFRFLAYFLGINYSALSSILGEGMGISSTGQLRIYFTSQAVGYATLGLSFMAIVFSISYIQNYYFKNRSLAILALSLCISSLMFFSASKGFMLGVIMILLILSFTYTLKSSLNYRINSGVVRLLLIASIIILILNNLEYLNIIEKVFDSSDSGNAIRYQQLSEIIKDCTFLGNGLGASINGCVRADDEPYGFELTYINVIHKFGIFSIIIFSMWIFMGIKSLKKIYNRRHLTNSIIVFSSLGYLFPSIGNPLLFHPSLVFLNSCALYLLKKEYD